jgi:2-methylcitrate dehydratase PrpD
MIMALTRDLGRFVADLSFERLPQDAAEVARVGFIDCISTMRRVRVETNQNYDPEVSGASVYDQVRVDLAGGGTVASEKVARAKGHADRPLSEDELFEKFRTCLDAGGARIAPEVLFDRLRRLEDLSARELTAG